MAVYYRAKSEDYSDSTVIILGYMHLLLSKKLMQHNKLYGGIQNKIVFTNYIRILV